MMPLAKSAIVIFSLIGCGPAFAATLSRAQAQRLADQAVRHVSGMKKFPTYKPDLNQFDGKDGRFFFFEEISPPQAQGSAHIRSLAVNKSTGDVWEIDGICGHMWPLLTAHQVAALRGRRANTPWECEKSDTP
jgi:hypothetical protein